MRHEPSWVSWTCTSSGVPARLDGRDTVMVMRTWAGASGEPSRERVSSRQRVFIRRVLSAPHTSVLVMLSLRDGVLLDELGMNEYGCVWWVLCRADAMLSGRVRKRTDRGGGGACYIGPD
jgi:hypothetical protein